LKGTKALLAKKFKADIPLTTIHSWLQEYKNLCTFSRLRKRALKLYSHQNILLQQTLSHIQPCTFKCHNAKLKILTKENPKFSALKGYINKISSKGFPNHIFTHNKNNNMPDAPNGQRASQLKFNHLKIKIISKNNHSNKLARLALNLAKNNNERHQAI